MEPPAKKSRPMVPLFGASGFGGFGGAGQSVPSAAPSATAAPSVPKVPLFGALGFGGAGQRVPSAAASGGAAPSVPKAGLVASPSATISPAPPAPMTSDSLRAALLTSTGSAATPAAGAVAQAPASPDRQPGAAPTRQAPGPTPRAPDCTGGTYTAPEPVAEKVHPGSLHKDLRSGQAYEQGGVYGFDSAASSGAGKAIALRLEPLKPGIPEYEKILGENKQSVLIGSLRGMVDVLVTEEVVSKKHVTLSLVGVHNELALCIVDTSTNGTYINGKRIEKKKRFRLRSGDKLQLMDPSIDDEIGWKVDFGNTVAFFSRH